MHLTKRPLIVLTALVLLATTSTQAGLAESRKIYESSLAKIEEDYEAKRDAIPGDYTRAIAALGNQAQAKGKLELLIGAKAEYKRFMDEKTVPEAASPDTPAEIVLAQQHYRSAGQQLALERCRTIVAFTDTYLAHLEKEKKRFTVEGKIEDALAAKQESARVKATAPYQAAQFALADAQASEQPAVEPATPAAPSPAPAAPAERVGAYVIRWDAGRTPDSVNIMSSQGRRTASLTHEGGNRGADRYIECQGGRSLIDDISPTFLAACKETDELTIEVVLQSASTRQTGPARILSFSLDGHNRNFSLCQENDQLLLRLRTTQTGVNGTSPEVKLCRIAEKSTMNVMVTYRPGELRLYLNGTEENIQQISGDFSNWDAHQLVIGNEWKGERPWRGRILRLGMANRVVERDAALRRTRGGWRMPEMRRR